MYSVEKLRHDFSNRRYCSRCEINCFAMLATTRNVAIENDFGDCAPALFASSDPDASRVAPFRARTGSNANENGDGDKTGRRAKSGGGSGQQPRPNSDDEVALRALVRADRHRFCTTIMFSISLTNRPAPTSLAEQEIAAFAKPRPRGRKRSMRRTSRHRNRPAVWDTLAASAPRPRARAPQFQNVFVEEVQTGRN